MLAIWGLLIVVIFMTLIMTKKATPFTSLVLTPVVVAIVAGAFGHLPLDAIAGDALAGVKGVAPTVVMLTFAIFYFGLMLTAGLYETSGDWLYEIGLPGKSGIGGGIVTVSPGKGGLGTFAPPLDEAGNSVRGQLATQFLSQRLGLDLLVSSPNR